MTARARSISGRILLSPREPLVAGGAAEAFEQRLQQLLREGHTSIVVDLSSVEGIDSAGIRALVRCHTTAQRIGGTLRLAAVRPAVSRTLQASRLDGVFDSYESVDAARIAAWPWRSIGTVAAGMALCAGLVWVGLRWQLLFAGAAAGGSSPFPPGTGDATGPAAAPLGLQPFVELAKLVAAAMIGLLVTAVHRPASRDRLMARSMAQAQMLLCVAGALMMIIIGNSLARAFGIAGAASIVRFRTPVDDPKDVTILFLLMGLGMATGLGAFAVAGLGSAFLCIALLLLDRLATQKTRLMSVEMSAPGRVFPTRHVEAVFVRNETVFEPREISQGKNAITVKYHTWLDPRASLDDLSAQLM